MRHLVSISTVALLAFACSGDVLEVQANNNRPGVETRTVELCTDGDPTEGFASFVVSDENGAVPSSDITITQLMDGDAPDSPVWEGGQSLGVENLSSDLHVTLLLDVSNSLLQAGQFEEMKQAAEELIRQGAASWDERPGTFTWQVIWFNRDVSAASDANGPWEFEDIQDIPTPDFEESDVFTRLYSAIDFAIRDTTAVRDAGTASGDRDNHLLAVFTDGSDNLSGLPSGDPEVASDVTVGGKAFDRFGTNPTDAAQLERLMENRDWLQVSFLALGNEVNREALDGLAAAGNGTVFGGNDIENLFSRAQSSFEILQNVGFRLPFNPDEPHLWELDFKVKGLKNPAEIRITVERKDDTPVCKEDDPTTPTEPEQKSGK